MVNTDLVSYCRIDLPSSHPGDDLWQNKQPFGPSSLSAATLSMEMCGLNQRSDDTQPSVVVLSVFGHEVERKHTIAEFVFFPSFFKKHKEDTNVRAHSHSLTHTHTHTHTHTRVCRRDATQTCTQSKDAHTGTTTHTRTPPPSVPRVTHPEIAELRPFQFFTS